MWFGQHTSFCFLSAFNPSMKRDMECWENACHIYGSGPCSIAPDTEELFLWFNQLSLHHSVTVTVLAYISPSSLHTWQAPADHQHFFWYRSRGWTLFMSWLKKNGNLILEQSRPTGRVSPSSTFLYNMLRYLTHTLHSQLTENIQ